MTIILTSLDNRLIDWCLMSTSALFQLYCGMNKCYINLDTLDNRHQKQNILVDVFKYNTVDVYEAVREVILDKIRVLFLFVIYVTNHKLASLS